MTISDLDYLELASKVTDIIGGDGAEVGVSVSAGAEGPSTIASTVTNTIAQALPSSGAVAFGFGYGFALAIPHPSPQGYGK